MNTYQGDPSDLYLTPKETSRTIADHLVRTAKVTGESAEQIRTRLQIGRGGLMDMLGEVRVTRERYADRYERPDQRSGVADSTDRLKAIPDEVRRVVARNEVVETQTIRHIREWQGLSGSRSTGLLLLGPAGAGKSLCASLLLRGSAIDVEPEGWMIGESVLAMHLNSGTKSDKELALTPLRSTPLLVVDYMGQRKSYSGWEQSILEFLRLRWEAGRRCVLTFRGDLDAFKTCYQADGWATVERFCTVLTVRREG